MFLRSLLILMLLVAAAPAVSGASLQRYFRVADGTAVELSPLLQDVAKADVIYIAESHDDLKHHAVQHKIIRSLHAEKLPLAIGVEMMTADSQQVLDDWVAGRIDEQVFVQVYARNWSYDWGLYRDIFVFARNYRIPMIALNVPKPLMQKVAALGSSALTEAERKELPAGMSWELNGRQTENFRNTFRKVFGGKGDEGKFRNLCEAQALRNSAIAWNIFRYLKEHKNGKVVVLTGTWHAIRHGVPEQLARHGEFVQKVILPELPEFNVAGATLQEADYFFMR